jgi:hypothetical protein
VARYDGHETRSPPLTSSLTMNGRLCVVCLAHPHRVWATQRKTAKEMERSIE